VLETLSVIGKITKQDNHRFILNTREASQVLQTITRISGESGINLTNLNVREATLEDIFLSLTGKKLRE